MSARTVRRSFTAEEANLLLDALEEQAELLSYHIGDATDGRTQQGEAVEDVKARRAALLALVERLEPK